MWLVTPRARKTLRLSVFVGKELFLPGSYNGWIGSVEHRLVPETLCERMSSFTSFAMQILVRLIFLRFMHRALSAHPPSRAQPPTAKSLQKFAWKFSCDVANFPNNLRLMKNRGTKFYSFVATKDGSKPDYSRGDLKSERNMME